MPCRARDLQPWEAPDFRKCTGFCPGYNFRVGAHLDGDGKDLGDTIVFRSIIAAGYRFDDRSRLTVALSHIPNAGLGDDNSDVNILDARCHVPASSILGDQKPRWHVRV